MKRLMLMLAAAALLQGCATADCDYLAISAAPESATPLKYPADVREATPSGEFRLPEVQGAVTEDCLVLPPQTLSPEMLKDPDELEEEAEEVEGSDEE